MFDNEDAKNEKNLIRIRFLWLCHSGEWDAKSRAQKMKWKTECLLIDTNYNEHSYTNDSPKTR